MSQRNYGSTIVVASLIFVVLAVAVVSTVELNAFVSSFEGQDTRLVSWDARILIRNGRPS